MSDLLSLTNFNGFLRSGQLGKIHLRTSKQEIFHFLGEPVFSNVENWEISNQTMTNLYYDSFLITMLDEDIAQITIYFRKNYEISKTLFNALDIDWYHLLRTIEPDQLQRYLISEGIRFLLLFPPDNNRDVTRYWIEKSQIQITFSEMNQQLDSIRVLSSFPSNWILSNP